MDDIVGEFQPGLVLSRLRQAQAREARFICVYHYRFPQGGPIKVQNQCQITIATCYSVLLLLR